MKPPDFKYPYDQTIITKSPLMWDVFGKLDRYIDASVDILIVGETGTGKELIAKAVHKFGKRTGRFEAVECPSIPAHLLESEMYGTCEGACTGAVERPGKFESANNGSTFLDEIAD